MSQFEYMSPCRFDNLHSLHNTLITLFLKELFVHMSVTPQPPLYVEMEKCLVMVEVTMVVLMQTHAILKVFKMFFL